MAFMLGVSEYWLVYHTSSLTLVISGVFKVSNCPLMWFVKRDQTVLFVMISSVVVTMSSPNIVLHDPINRPVHYCNHVK